MLPCINIQWEATGNIGDAFKKRWGGGDCAVPGLQWGGPDTRAMCLFPHLLFTPCSVHPETARANHNCLSELLQAWDDEGQRSVLRERFLFTSMMAPRDVESSVDSAVGTVSKKQRVTPAVCRSLLIFFCRHYVKPLQMWAWVIQIKWAVFCASQNNPLQGFTFFPPHEVSCFHNCPFVCWLCVCVWARLHQNNGTDSHESWWKDVILVRNEPIEVKFGCMIFFSPFFKILKAFFNIWFDFSFLLFTLNYNSVNNCSF